jgi:hypothetical protein
MGDRTALPVSWKRWWTRSRASIFDRHTTDTSLQYVARMGFEAPLAPGGNAGQGALKHDLAEYVERLDREIKMIRT